MASAKKAKRLKISELAEKAGVTIPTIRHYLKEGLLPQPVKTGQTMAYYDPECIDRIRLIKRLQRERFLPIEVIKRVINTGEVFTEESEIGQILTRSNLFRAKGGTLTAGELTAATGYPASKLRKLHRDGVVVPKKAESGSCYDALDAELVKLIQKAEDAGLPTDFTLDTIKMYSKAVEAVVSKNTRRILARLITDVPVENMGRVLTETEESLDALVLLLRQKSVRRINEAALGELNTMAQKLDAMIFFPVDGRYLPETVPEKSGEKIFYDFCTGNYSNVPDACRLLPKEQAGRWSLLCRVLAHLCAKDANAAVRLTENHLAEPADDSMANSIAALAYVYAAAFSPGITGPMKQVKKAWPFLEKSHGIRKSSKLDRLLTQYVCGSVYTALPEIFGFGEKGRVLLARAAGAIRGNFPGTRGWPQWVILTLAEEIMPAIKHRINRILARWYTDNITDNDTDTKE
jgi:DNA-binding transcriptional MerR regulator